MKHKKPLVAILLILVFLFSLTALIACNNDDEDQKPSELENQINSFIAYGANNYTFYSISAFKDESDSEYFGDGVQWHMESSFTNNYETNATSVELYKYDTEENAKTALLYVFDAQNDPTYKRDGKIIIKTNTLGIYDAIKASSLPTSVTSSTVYSYSIKTLRSKINNSSYLIYAYGGHNNYSDEDMSNFIDTFFTLQATPKGSNCEECYYCSTSYAWDEDIQDQIGVEYTNDSYSKVENNIHYTYIKYKPGFRYELTEDGNGYAITAYYYERTNGTVIIPNTYNNKPVTEIAQGGLYYLPNDIKKIVIPNSVTKIGDIAFKECHGLESIVIPSSVIEIGSLLFLEDEALTKIYCEAQSKPAGWDDYWNRGCDAEVVWGYNG